MIICITGLPGSGKTTVATILKDRNFTLVEMGDIVRRKMREEGIDRTHESVREYAMNIRKKHGKDIVAKYAVEEFANADGNIAVSGVRSLHELNIFRNALKNVYVIAVTASAETRFMRLKSRGKPEDPKTVKEFEWLDQREKQGFMAESDEEQYGVMKLMEMADYVIPNTGRIDDLRSKLDDLLSEIPI